MLICCFIFSYRKLALFLCDWDITEENLRERLHRLVTNNQTERAAAMALFHNKLDLTIEILGNPSANQKKGSQILGTKMLFLFFFSVYF